MGHIFLYPQFIPRDGYVAGAVVAAVCLIVSAYPVAQQQKNNDLLLTRTNLFVTESVETMRDTTEADARIATIWAGVPAYYSNRTMLDLLGKNDTFIATSAPHGEFFPGHNKWDYNYSIGELQPDVVFQTFDRGLEENLHQRIMNWGYKKMCPITGYQRSWLAKGEKECPHCGRTHMKVKGKCVHDNGVTPQRH